MQTQTQLVLIGTADDGTETEYVGGALEAAKTLNGSKNTPSRIRKAAAEGGGGGRVFKRRWRWEEREMEVAEKVEEAADETAETAKTAKPLDPITALLEATKQEAPAPSPFPTDKEVAAALSQLRIDHEEQLAKLPAEWRYDPTVQEKHGVESYSHQERQREAQCRAWKAAGQRRRKTLAATAGLELEGPEGRFSFPDLATAVQVLQLKGALDVAELRKGRVGDYKVTNPDGKEWRQVRQILGESQQNI